MSNIEAAKAVADAVRTSLGPKGMDKMIKDDKENVTITNDGATILQRMKVLHPAARMLVELSKAQDIEAGDGTTTVVVICGALLEAAKELLAHGSHPTRISDAFQRAASEAMKVLDTLAIPFDLKNRDAMIKAAQTSLSSKVKFYSTGNIDIISIRNRFFTLCYYATFCNGHPGYNDSASITVESSFAPHINSSFDNVPLPSVSIFEKIFSTIASVSVRTLVWLNFEIEFRIASISSRDICPLLSKS